MSIRIPSVKLPRDDPRQAWAYADISLEENPAKWKFNTVSLRQWLNLCKDAKVPYLSAEFIADLDIDYLLKTEQMPALLYEKAVSGPRGDSPTMVRWDCCSPLGIKINCAEGDFLWKPAYADIPMLDPRAFEILYEFPHPSVRLWRRAWLKGEMVDGYPVEYRVFVEDGEIVGVSNYYPQRDLPFDIDDIRTVLEHTYRLIAELGSRPCVQPANRQTPGAVDPNFTVDYIKNTKNKMLLFLEGGPSFFGGAHPCCFPKHRQAWGTGGADRVEGVPIALSQVQSYVDE